jgi:hypothetical protein
MEKILTTFLLTGIMLTGCTKAIDTKMNGIQNNVPTVKSDVEKDFEDLTVQANLGDGSSQAQLGLIYYYGRGVPQDYSKAFYWLQQAANHGHKEMNRPGIVGDLTF